MNGVTTTAFGLNLSQSRRNRFCDGEATSRWSRVSLEHVSTELVGASPKFRAAKT